MFTKRKKKKQQQRKKKPKPIDVEGVKVPKSPKSQQPKKAQRKVKPKPTAKEGEPTFPTPPQSMDKKLPLIGKPPAHTVECKVTRGVIAGPKTKVWYPRGGRWHEFPSGLFPQGSIIYLDPESPGFSRWRSLGAIEVVEKQSEGESEGKNVQNSN